MTLPNRKPIQNTTAVVPVNYPQVPVSEFPDYFENKYPEVVKNFRNLEQFCRDLLAALDQT